MRTRRIRSLCDCCLCFRTRTRSSSSSAGSSAAASVPKNTVPPSRPKNRIVIRIQKFLKMSRSAKGPTSPGMLFNLPLELFNEIMAYLDRTDLAKLSSCCRASRNLLSRDVFGHLPESLTLDKKEGMLKPFPGVESLRHLQSYFSYVVLKPPISYDYTSVTSPLQLENIYTYVECLKYFPNIDRLWICWELPADCPDEDSDIYREALVAGILKRLVTYEFWGRLNLFGLERYKPITGSDFRQKEQVSVSWHFGGIRVFREPEKYVRGAPERYIKASSCEDHEDGCSCFAPGFQTTYMEVRKFGFGEAAKVGGRWGMGESDVVLLNTLDVHTDTFVGTPFEDEEESDAEDSSSCSSSTSSTTSASSPSPLKALNTGLIYPFIKKLVLSVKTGITRSNILELTIRCPNISHLRIDGELLVTNWDPLSPTSGYAYQKDEVLYSELMVLKSLETAIIPWPSISGGSSSDRMNMNFQQAEQSIITWAEVGGLRLLRYISFVNNCRKYPGSHWTRTYGVCWGGEGWGCEVGVTYFSEKKY
ncbi:hypothetical protein TWF481_006608 [Arthrobotrys musiformis]|uniref:F-box domain-containing protein n=1 Tax=Arthrobotrys musiformis TaxID=47236 RepID=A0AAV9W920_9PEZI